MSGEGLIEGVITIFLAIVLIYAFVQALWQISAGYAILFFILAIAMVVGVILSMFRR